MKTTNLNLRRFTRIVLAASLMFTALAMPTAALAEEFVPIEGKFAGVGDTFSGNFSHLGRFSGVINQEALTAVWTAANGDTVTNQTTSFEITGVISPTVVTYRQTIDFTGGTGRFNNAIGTGVILGTIDVTTGAYDGNLNGSISRPNSR